MIIDSHHHFWNYNKKDYGWINESMNMLKQEYLPQDLYTLIKKNGVNGTVVVQARQKIEETKWLLELAEIYDFIYGVVGWIDLCAENTEEQLELFAEHEKLVGIRHVLQDEPNDAFMLQTQFIRGLKLLKKYNLCYDILIYPKHLKNTINLVSQLPDQKFVIDHLAKPNIKERKIEPWKSDIMHISKFPNVLCKFSGLITEAQWNNWRYVDLIPYIDIALEAFGTSRLMFGSDWPVCNLAGNYQTVIRIAQKYFSNFSMEEQNNIFNNNCKRFYSL